MQHNKHIKHALTRKNVNDAFGVDNTGLTGDSNLNPKTVQQHLLESKKQEEINRFNQQGETKELAKDGIWLVPVEERPKGWEKMEVKEPE